MHLVHTNKDHNLVELTFKRAEKSSKYTVKDELCFMRKHAAQKKKTKAGFRNPKSPRNMQEEASRLPSSVREVKKSSRSNDISSKI